MRKYLVFGGLALLFCFRLWLAVNAKHGDMYNNLDWGYGAVEYGLNGFYELPKPYWNHSVPNQPPGSIYLHLASVSLYTLVDQMINWSNDKIQLFPSRLVWWWPLHGELIAIKLPSMLADLAIFAAILKTGKIFNRSKASLIIGFIFLINPAMWYNSSFWGQTDPVVAALSVWSLVFLFSGRLLFSPVLLGLSFITKASWLFFVPLYGLYYLLKYPKKTYLLLAIPLTMLFVSVPFHLHLDIASWLANLYSHRILSGESAFITVIAFNFWNLVYSPDFVPYKILFHGFPANLVGWAIVAAILSVLAFRLVRRVRPQNLIWLGILLSYAVFLFAPKMIHRYLYPAFPLLSLFFVFSKSKLLWLIYFILSACYIINLYYKWWAPGSLWLQSFYTDANTKIISAIYLAVFAFLLVFKPKTYPPSQKTPIARLGMNAKKFLLRRDFTTPTKHRDINTDRQVVGCL